MTTKEFKRAKQLEYEIKELQKIIERGCHLSITYSYNCHDTVDSDANFRTERYFPGILKGFSESIKTMLSAKLQKMQEEFNLLITDNERTD